MLVQIVGKEHVLFKKAFVESQMTFQGRNCVNKCLI